MPKNKLATLAVSPEAWVFYKPRGISCVSLGPTETSSQDASAVALAIAALPELAALQTGAPGRPNEHGLLHRLDRETTGCLAFARTLSGYTNLKIHWRQATKIYRAIVEDRQGIWQSLVERPDEPVRIDFPIGHSQKSKRRMVVLDPRFPGRARSIRGKALPALTYAIAAQPLQDGRVDLTLQINTGVRHQIRAHLAAIGTPLWRDPIYGAPAPAPYLLHAWKLNLPETPDAPALLATAPLPQDWPVGTDL